MGLRLRRISPGDYTTLDGACEVLSRRCQDRLGGDMSAGYTYWLWRPKGSQSPYGEEPHVSCTLQQARCDLEAFLIMENEGARDATIPWD
jgi:hypothetical protein